MCAEQVQEAALVCRFCGHRFGAVLQGPPAGAAATHTDERSDRGHATDSSPANSAHTFAPAPQAVIGALIVPVGFFWWMHSTVVTARVGGDSVGQLNAFEALPDGHYWLSAYVVVAVAYSLAAFALGLGNIPPDDRPIPRLLQVLGVAAACLGTASVLILMEHFLSGDKFGMIGDQSASFTWSGWVFWIAVLMFFVGPVSLVAGLVAWGGWRSDIGERSNSTT